MQRLSLRIPLGRSLRILAALLLLSTVFFCFERVGTADGGEKVWLVVKARERRLELVSDYSYRMDGAGHVNFKEGGRVVELPEGLSILVNDKKVEGEQRVNEDETVRVVNSRGETLWKLSPVRREEMWW